MAPSLLMQVVESELFRSEVASMIQRDIWELDCTCYPDGIPTPGRIVDYEIFPPLNFGEPAGEGRKYQLAITGTGVASGECGTGEIHYTYAHTGKFLGEVFLELCPDALRSETLVLALEKISIRVELTEIDINDETPSQGPAERFAGES